MNYTKEDVESYFYRYTSRKVGSDCMLKNQEEYDLYRSYIDLIRRRIKKRNRVKRVIYYSLVIISATLFFITPVILHSSFNLAYAGFASMAIGGGMLYILINNPIKSYTIYNFLGDIKFENDYSTTLSEVCVLIKHWHNTKQNRLTPVSLGRKNGLPEHYMEMLGFKNLYKEELVAYVILADAMIVDKCLAYNQKKWYTTASDADFLKLPHDTIIEKYYKEI